MTETQPLLSPRLTVLQRALTSGDEAAFDLFWQEMEAEGTPLIEAIPGDGSHVLTTFLYHASLVGNPVEVVCALAGRGLIHEPMTCLLGTSLWYKTYRVSPGLRTEYWFAVNGEAQPDRLNSRLLLFPPDEDALFDQDTTESWFEIPPAEAESWLEVRRPGILSGQVEHVRLKSQRLGNERPLSIYTPACSDTSSQPSSLLILFDRWVYAHVLPTFAMLDQLIAQGSIPPTFVVMVGHSDKAARLRELPCHAPFAEFLARELLPWIRQRYQVSFLPTQTVVGGMSYGGLAAAYAGLRYPELFGHVLSQSGSFSWKPEGQQEYEWVARQLAASPRLPLRWYLSAGVLETPSWEGARPNALLANRHLRDVLQAKGYPLHYREFNGGHDFVWQLPVLAEGLSVLIGPGGKKD